MFWGTSPWLHFPLGTFDKLWKRIKQTLDAFLSLVQPTFNFLQDIFLTSWFHVFAEVSVPLLEISSRPNLIPRALSSFKMAVGETPGQGCWNTPRIVGVFCYVTHDEMAFSEVGFSSGSPVCFLQSETVVETKRRHFKVFTWQNFNELLEPFWQPWPGVSPTAILNAEKALGTRLALAQSRQYGIPASGGYKTQITRPVWRARFFYKLRTEFVNEKIISCVCRTFVCFQSDLLHCS